MYKKILSAVCICAMQTGCGVTEGDPVLTGTTSTTMTTTGTTISALATTTAAAGTEAIPTTNTTVSTTDYTIPSLPEITISTSTSAETTAESAVSTETTAAQQTSAAAQTSVTVGKEFTVEGETVTVKAGAKKVAYTIKVHNNPGFASATVIMGYGSLKPVGDEKTHEAEYVSDIGKNAIITCMYNNDTQLMAFAMLGQKDTKENGTLVTLYFDLPADAKAGSEYPISLTANECANNAGKKITPKIITGKIVVS
ncbi:MAG: hypothetical protein IK130_06105 [Oscillospiraceae bacterium]|nr:hypothetical protein [Oscillospiraceae bacterium]